MPLLSLLALLPLLAAPFAQAAALLVALPALIARVALLVALLAESILAGLLAVAGVLLAELLSSTTPPYSLAPTALGP